MVKEHTCGRRELYCYDGDGSMELIESSYGTVGREFPLRIHVQSEET